MVKTLMQQLLIFVNSLAHEVNVAPVVITSSTSKMCLFSKSRDSLIWNIVFTFEKRSIRAFNVCVFVDETLMNCCSRTGLLR